MSSHDAKYRNLTPFGERRRSAPRTNEEAVFRSLNVAASPSPADVAAHRAFAAKLGPSTAAPKVKIMSTDAPAHSNNVPGEFNVPHLPLPLDVYPVSREHFFSSCADGGKLASSLELALKACNIDASFFPSEAKIKCYCVDHEEEIASSSFNLNLFRTGRCREAGSSFILDCQRTDGDISLYRDCLDRLVARMEGLLEAPKGAASSSSKKTSAPRSTAFKAMTLAASFLEESQDNARIEAIVKQTAGDLDSDVCERRTAACKRLVREVESAAKEFYESGIVQRLRPVLMDRGRPENRRLAMTAVRKLIVAGGVDDLIELSREHLSDLTNDAQNALELCRTLSEVLGHAIFALAIAAGHKAAIEERAVRRVALEVVEALATRMPELTYRALESIQGSYNLIEESAKQRLDEGAYRPARAALSALLAQGTD